LAQKTRSQQQTTIENKACKNGRQESQEEENLKESRAASFPQLTDVGTLLFVVSFFTKGSSSWSFSWACFLQSFCTSVPKFVNRFGICEPILLSSPCGQLHCAESFRPFECLQMKIASLEMNETKSNV